MFSVRGKTNGISGKCWVNGSDAWMNWYTDKMYNDIIANDKTTNDKMSNGQNA